MDNRIYDLSKWIPKIGINGCYELWIYHGLLYHHNTGMFNIVLLLLIILIILYIHRD